MPDQFRAAITLPCLSGILVSFLLEALLHPRPQRFWRRPPAALLLHIGLVILLFAAELLLFWRPWFAMANMLAVLLFLLLVNNAKFDSLREPFIFQDFEYFSDALKHPRLYLPFFGIGRTLLAVTGVVGILVTGMLLESPVSWNACLTASGLLLMLGAGCVWLGNRLGSAVTCEPCEDIARLGQLACLWLYGTAERIRLPDELPANLLFRFIGTEEDSSGLPDLIAVQSESFFDPRRSFSGISPGILEQFDRLKSSAAACGILKVPAWGANTVRTEYAFLSGLESKKLGIHQFNPYRWIARQKIPTLAGFLKHRGYRTVCIHPYPASFYNRDSVYPLMGFDEFIDVRAFQGAACAGPYVGDREVVEKIRVIMDEHRSRESSAPLLIFVITMENHGPLHLESVADGEAEQLHSQPPPVGCEDLTVYLRHLSNADQMIGAVRETLENSSRAGWLCFFGDHLPIMANVYQTLGYPDGDSDYVIWSNRSGNDRALHMDLHVEDLGVALVRHAGLSR